MKRIIVILFLGSAMALTFFIGCTSPPVGTVWIDTDGNGKIDALAIDADSDGFPDVDANGNFVLADIGVSGSVIEAADLADAVGPGIMSTVGGLLSGFVPWAGIILVSAAGLWNKSKFGRIIMNTVATVQAARKAIAESNSPEILSIVDDALSAQLPETVKMVKEIKEKYDIASVAVGESAK